MSTVESRSTPVSQARAHGPTDFRRDINGLRTWAVVAVVLFHFGVPGFDGGFVGVDVFFVISGFLMTRIICAGLQEGNFSFLDFVQARAVRIFPALLALCAALLALGWLVLLPPDYRLLGTHVLYSLTFLSNVEFWREAGYFDAASHEKWLLHTWSLSVEWQFYLLLPLLLMLLARFAGGARARHLAVLALALVSLGACVLLTPTQPSASFFLLPTRAWELLAGGLVAMSALPARLTPYWRRRCQYLGLAMIAASIVLFDRHAAWPGAAALLPVTGAMLVLAAARESFWTGNRVAQWLGDRSYSIYLWHWPICVAMVYLGQADNPYYLVAGLVATCACAMASFSLVEQPARRALRRGTLPMRAVGLALPMLLVAVAGAAVWRAQGIHGRFDAGVEQVAAAADDSHPMRARCHQHEGIASPACVFGGKQPRVFLVGDSHAAALVTSVAESAARQDEAGVMQLSYSGCVFLPGMKLKPGAATPASYDCEGHNRWVADEIAAAAPDLPVIIVGRYAAPALGRAVSVAGQQAPSVHFGEGPHASATPEFLREFGRRVTDQACTIARTRPVFMVRPIPEMPHNVPKTISRKMAWGGEADMSLPREEYMRRNGWIWQAQDEASARCGVKIIDPTKLLCDDRRCYASKNGRPLYFDDNHLSEYGNRLLAPLFAAVHQPGAAGAP